MVKARAKNYTKPNLNLALELACSITEMSLNNLSDNKAGYIEQNHPKHG